MAIKNAAQAAVKTVADPNAAYESLKPLWNRCRAFCSGERFVKDFDSLLDTTSYTNLLIPFSPSMTPEQYSFYKAEAELPGITAQFAKMIVGGLLRKQPILKLPEGYEDDVNWFLNEFGSDDSPITSFMTEAMNEEVETSRAWVFVDYPYIANPDSYTAQQRIENFKPFPVLWKAESVINWHYGLNSQGKRQLRRVIIRGFEERYAADKYHPDIFDVVHVHELNELDQYIVKKYEKKDPERKVPVIAGKTFTEANSAKGKYELVSLNDKIRVWDQPLNFIPAWPLNGNIECIEPILSRIVDKERALYNKISRRNHLLYGASTYTPIISSDMTPEEFQKIVEGGLGSWLHLRQGDTAEVLETPTAALADMEVAIAANIEEMAKLGIKTLAPEVSQSGVALEIRNAAPTAQLGALNTAVSNTMRQVFSFMLLWRYGEVVKPSEIEFSLSNDFNTSVYGEGWLRLATEWYESGLIPRSIWVEILKQNDVMPSTYDDVAGREEISQDVADAAASQNDDYANSLEK